MAWIGLTKRAADIIGMLPEIFNEQDPRPAAAQAEERYAHGGGWQPMTGWTFDRDMMRIEYPGDDSLSPAAVLKLPLTGETIIVYPHAWVLVLQQDGSYAVARMD